MSKSKDTQNIAKDTARSRFVGEHIDAWRMGMVEGMGACASLCRDSGHDDACDTIIAEMTRRFPELASVEIAKRGLV